MIISFKGNGGGGGYVLPTATDTRLGGVKVGSGLTVQEDGTLSADGGGSGVEVVSSLDEITNPTKGMTAIIPEGTVRNMKGWRWSGATQDDLGSIHIFDDFHHVDYGELSLYSDTNKNFYSNFGNIEFGQVFNSFVYNSSIKALFKASGIQGSNWQLDVLFPEDVFDNLSLIGSAAQYAEVVESDETLGIYDADMTYVYRDEELLNIDCSGMTVDVTNVASDYNWDIAYFTVAWGNQNEGYSTTTATITRKQWNDKYAYWINNTAFVDDNKWRATFMKEMGHITLLFKQSGNTLYLKAFVSVMTYDISGVTAEAVGLSSSTVELDGGSNVTITQGWENQNNIVTSNSSNKSFFNIFDYESQLSIYKLISFARAYNQNSLFKTEALSTFKVSGRGFLNSPVLSDGGVFGSDIVLSFVDKDKGINKIIFRVHDEEFDGGYEGAPYTCSFEYEGITKTIYNSVFDKDVWVTTGNTLIFRDSQPDADGVIDSVLSEPGRNIDGWTNDNSDEMSQFNNISKLMLWDDGAGDNSRLPNWINPKIKFEDANQTFGDHTANKKMTLVYTDYTISFYFAHQESWIAGVTVTKNPITAFWKGSQADYNALSPNYDNNTLYVIV